MSIENGYPLSPTVSRGALVQLLEDLGAIVPNVVPFQYNPAKVTRGVTPWNPFQTSQQSQAAQTPLVQPFDPEETYTFELEYDAADDIEMRVPSALTSGVASRLAALRKLVEPSKGLFGDLVGTANALVGSPSRRAERPTVPVTLLLLGTSLMLPVRITSLSIEILEFTPQLHPLVAKATLELRVLTPDVFKCRSTTATDIAVAAYNFTKLQNDALAVANVENVVAGIASLVPL